MVLHEVELAFDAGEGFCGDTSVRISEHIGTEAGFRLGGFIVFKF